MERRFEVIPEYQVIWYDEEGRIWDTDYFPDETEAREEGERVLGQEWETQEEAKKRYGTAADADDANPGSA